MEDVNPEISIVVPIYNVEKYINKSITSILTQPFSKFELILVNDGSTDNCKKICDEFAHLDKRIKVIHKKNGGLSSARNAGIDLAIGKYITFIDPDDQICKHYFNKLYNIAEQKKCEVVVSGYKTVPTNNVISPGYKLNTLMSGKDFILSSLNIHSNNDLCFVWRNIYNLELIKEKNIRFNEQVFIGEDVIFNLEVFLSAKKLYAIPDYFYLYTVNNPESLMRVAYKPKLESSLVLQHKIRKQLSEKFGLLSYKHYKKDMASYYINNILKLILTNLKYSEKFEIKNDLKRVVNYSMITESLKEIGFFYKCNNAKEYIYYLALKLKIFPILLKTFERSISNRGSNTVNI